MERKSKLESPDHGLFRMAKGQRPKADASHSGERGVVGRRWRNGQDWLALQQQRIAAACTVQCSLSLLQSERRAETGRDRSAKAFASRRGRGLT